MEGADRPPALVPELDVSDLASSLEFYVHDLGFTVLYARPEDGFVYLEREGAHLMLEVASGPGRRFLTAPLEPPFGRGINLQIEVSDVDDVCQRVLARARDVVIPLEERWYRRWTEGGTRQPPVRGRRSGRVPPPPVPITRRKAADLTSKRSM